MPRPAELHPVLCQRAFVITSPPVTEAEAMLDECLLVGELALCLHGPPRTGKSTCQRYLGRRLEAARRAVVVSVRMNRTQQLRIDQADFWSACLKARDLAPLHSSHGLLREQLSRALLVASDTQGTERIVLMFDEAQTMTLQHLALLKVFVDDLIDKGLSPFVLLVAQPEITDHPKRLRNAKCQDLIDRFFTRWHRLRGLSPNEFGDFIGVYDAMRWPEPDGPSFPGYFAPKLVAQGWTVRSTETEYQSAFKTLNKKLGLGELQELETKFLVAALRLLLTDIRRAGGSCSDWQLRQFISTSVARSGLTEARQKVGDAEDVVG